MKLLFSILLIASNASGQDFKKEGAFSFLTTFQPDGYVILDTASGDLNRDEYRDLIVVYKHSDEKNLSTGPEEPLPRPLLIYIGQGGDSLRLAKYSQTAVYCLECGGVFGDPFSRVVIKNGYFTIEHYGGSSWRWTRFVTFTYSPQDTTWLLHRDGGESYHTSDPDNSTQTMKTVKDFGKVRFEDFDIYEGYE